MNTVKFAVAAILLFGAAALYISAPLTADQIIRLAQADQSEVMNHIDQSNLEANLAAGISERFNTDQSLGGKGEIGAALLGSITSGMAKGLTTEIALMPVLKNAQKRGYHGLNTYALSSEVAGQPLTVTLSRQKLVLWRVTDIDGAAF